MQPTISEHIESKPDVRNGKPCIAGTGIRVQDVYVWHELQGMSADEIVNAYPHLTLSGVYAALAYYFDHVQEIRQQMEQGRERAEAIMQNNPPKLPKKLAAKDADADSLSHR